MPRKGPSTIQERLSRSEGQLKAVRKMVEEGEELSKTLIQLQAVISSLESTKLEIVKKEVREQLVGAIDNAVDLLR